MMKAYADGGDPTPAANTPAPAAATPAVNQKEHLNSAFKIPPDVCQKLIDEGVKGYQAHKQLGDLVGFIRQNPVGVIGEKGKSHQSYVYFTSYNGAELITASYQSAANFVPLDVPDYKTNGLYFHEAQFNITLCSTPKVGTNIWTGAASVTRTASPDDVAVTKFVLTDDSGAVIFPVGSSSQGVSTGDMQFSGTAVIPHADTQRTNSTATVNAYGSDGSSATASGYGTSTTTTLYNQYIPWSVSHPYYEANYSVTFPLFDANGNPLVTDAAKSVTLHMITPNGEMDTTYNLNPVKP
jgi:hypothetical protein